MWFILLILKFFFEIKLSLQWFPPTKIYSQLTLTVSSSKWSQITILQITILQRAAIYKQDIHLPDDSSELANKEFFTQEQTVSPHRLWWVEPNCHWQEHLLQLTNHTVYCVRESVHLHYYVCPTVQNASKPGHCFQRSPLAKVSICHELAVHGRVQCDAKCVHKEWFHIPHPCLPTDLLNIRKDSQDTAIGG